MLIGSSEPIAIDVDAIRSRARHPATVEHYRRAGLISTPISNGCDDGRRREQPPVDLPDQTFNTDLFPRDELRPVEGGSGRSPPS